MTIIASVLQFTDNFGITRAVLSLTFATHDKCIAMTDIVSRYRKGSLNTIHFVEVEEDMNFILKPYLRPSQQYLNINSDILLINIVNSN